MTSSIPYVDLHRSNCVRLLFIASPTQREKRLDGLSCATREKTRTFSVETTQFHIGKSGSPFLGRDAVLRQSLPYTLRVVRSNSNGTPPRKDLGGG